MRKLIFQEWLSLDGFAADAKGEVKFIESAALNKYSDDDLLKMMDNIDAILLGANTYRLFVDFWPTATTAQEVIAESINQTPKFIFSSSMEAAPWGHWPAATLIKEEAVEAVKKMKAQQGKNIVLWGSISLAQAFMRANLIDEYHLRICPFTLGSGRLLFENIGAMQLELFDTKQYESGLLQLRYRPVVL
ncbi:MAG: dihydrofolate reductase family protein [Chitinophagaceae bacterium]